MDKLQQQCTCFEAIKKLCENYKKDSASRKTKDYLENKLTSLESQWKDFEERHGALLIEISDKNIPYFSETVFEKLKIIADSTKTNMMHLLKQLQAAETKPVNFDLSGLLEDATDETLSRLLNKQECNFKAIDRVMSKIDIQSINEKWELEDSLGLLKSKWEAIDKLHWELENLLNGSNENYYRLFVSVEDKYDEMKKDLNRKIWSTVHYQQSAPRIEIPEFSGSYSQWNSFKDIFIETIHSNPTINKAQKMQHLKTKLRGEAEKLVQHLAISAENYESCWEILNHRFENRRLQFTSFMNTMLNLPTIQHPDAQKLKRMHDVITECLNGLSNMGIDTATWDPMIVHLMSQKLMETSLYGEYVKELHDHREIPNLNEFLSFLEGKFMAFETMGTTKKETANSSNQHSSKTFNKQYPLKKLNYYEYKKLTPKSYHTVYGQCLLCDGKHVLMQCPKFVSAEPRERKSIVAKLQVCKNCLYSHGHLECKSTKTCKECNMKHHTLLHYVTAAAGSNSTPNYIGKNQPPQRTHNSPQQQQASNHLSNTDTEILLTTVQLKVKTIDGTYVPLRALLDQGSQVNLISENAAQLLKLHRRKLTATITGIGSVSGDCKGKLQLTSKSIHNDFSFDFEALIMKKLTNNLPNSSFNKANWPHLENLKLADPDYNVSRSVDVLLGADVYSKIILDGVLRGGQQAPIAQQTHLGWILCGKLQTFNCHATLIDVNELTKFWECEDITQGNDDSSKDDQCEKHYAETVQRGPDGKYTVKMPMVPNFEENLGNSKSIAISQFLQLERRLERNKKLALMYRDFIKEYADMGHLKPSLQQSKSECYLPHHGVLKEHSTTTKLRVVFNASQKTTSGFSLNNLQEKGANLQKDIQALIIKWRVYKYAYTADIEKMFRAIWVAEEQQALQKIIWRDSPREKLQELQLCTVTYGTKSAPWLAMRTLLQLALDDKQKYPAAAEILQKEVFVDDLISGHNSLDEAKKLQHELINLLRGGGMNLRKWSSNHPALLEDLTSDQLSTKNIFDFKTEDTTKTLGLGWNPHDDIFVMNWSLELGTESQITKRYLLSEISKLYDPLGWFSPITIKAKLLFQQVWMSKLGWDDNLPKPIQQEWLKLKAEMTQLKTVKLNRWLGGTQNNLELLGFCDASEKAYSCVIYSRVINEEGMPVITLLVAKTRVSPLAQKTTLPRLELCGALLLSQLIEKTKQALSGYTITVRAWSDSQVVLAWLQGEASRWETYVANRTAKIKKQIPAEQWHYVRSEENPADCASRGLYPSKLVNYSLWWEGPDFLKTDETQCSDKQDAACLFSTNLESANHTQLRGQTNKPCESIISELLHKHSSYTRAKRIIAWILRFINNVRVKTKPETTYLTTSELLAANNEIIKCAQKSDFAFEYKLLQKNDSVPSSSSVYKLNPYMDSNGIIRVGGRLNNSTLPPEMKREIKDIYKLLHVKARITETYFLCEIHIPLIGDEDFTLYRIIPLPIKTQENATKLIQVSTAYIAVNFRKNTYMSMQHEDLKRCTQRSKDNFICRAILPVHNLHYKNAPCEAKLIGQQTALPCEMRSASCKDYWIELHSPNTWLHVCCDKCSLRSICNNDVSLHATDYSGILTLKQGCMVQARDTTIYSKNQFSSNVKMEPDLSFYAPLLNNSINRIVNLTIHGLPELSQPDKWNLSEVDKRLALQRTSELHLPSKISTHDIHQYVISYCLLAAGFTAFGIWILKRRCPDLCKKRVHVSAQFEDIELKAIPRRNQRTRKSDSGPSADNIAFNFE